MGMAHVVNPVKISETQLRAFYTHFIDVNTNTVMWLFEYALVSRALAIAGDRKKYSGSSTFMKKVQLQFQCLALTKNHLHDFRVIA